MITGTPKSGVSALMGRSVPPSGKVLRPRQSEQQRLPKRIVTGSSLPWSSVLSSILATCGIDNPTKAIGPHHAVVTAARRPVTPLEVHTQIHGISFALHPAVERLDQEEGDKKTYKYQPDKAWQFGHTHAAEVTHSPKHQLLEALCRSIISQQGDER